VSESCPANVKQYLVGELGLVVVVLVVTIDLLVRILRFICKQL